MKAFKLLNLGKIIITASLAFHVAALSNISFEKDPVATESLKTTKIKCVRSPQGALNNQASHVLRGV